MHPRIFLGAGHPPWRGIAHAVGIAPGAVKQVLNDAGSCLPGPLGNRPAVLARQVRTTTTVLPGANSLQDVYNCDGCLDLTIGAPQSGAVRVLHGSAGGRATPPLQVLDASKEYTDLPEQGWGSALHGGHLDGDGYADLLSFVAGCRSMANRAPTSLSPRAVP